VLELVARVHVKLAPVESAGHGPWGERRLVPIVGSEYYFRIHATLETGAPAYMWLNERIFVASATRHLDAVVYDLYAVT